MSIVKLEEAFGEINPKATIFKELVTVSKQIDTTIDETLPTLKTRLAAMLANGKAIDIISVEVEAEVQSKIDKVTTTLDTEAKNEEIV